MKLKIANLICILLIFICASCNEKKEAYSEQKETEDPAVAKKKSVERGEYLVTVIGCDHCHTPKKMTENGPVPDLDRWMMGYPGNDPLPEVPENAVGPGRWVLLTNDLTAAVGPWGTSFGANLTPDDTGIGSWSFEQFKKALREGKYKGMDNSRPIMPPMPWESIGHLTDEDLRAIYDYLMSIKPIENVVPSYRPPAGAM